MPKIKISAADLFRRVADGAGVSVEEVESQPDAIKELVAELKRSSDTRDEGIAQLVASMVKLSTDSNALITQMIERVTEIQTPKRGPVEMKIVKNSRDEITGMIATPIDSVPVAEPSASDKLAETYK